MFHDGMKGKFLCNVDEVIVKKNYYQDRTRRIFSKWGWG